MRRVSVMTLLVLAAVVASSAAAVEPSGTMRLSVPDVVLLDQNGARVRVPDLVAGRVVVMNFVFTSCTTICSPMGANFGELQKHVGPDVRLISVTIDPGTDTPARLRKWSQQFHAGNSWTLLTGDPEDVERLLKSLGVYTPNRFNHGPVLLVGDAANGRWVRANGLAPAAEVMAMIRRVGSTATAGERMRR